MRAGLCTTLAHTRLGCEGCGGGCGGGGEDKACTGAPLLLLAVFGAGSCCQGEGKQGRPGAVGRGAL